MKQTADKQQQMDFKYWMDLAQQDPEQFEVKRLEAIDKLIESMSEDHKLQLRRLQWRIDQVRQRSGTPMAATIAISRMMWDAFYNLRDHYQDMFNDQTGGKRVREQSVSAEVITFPGAQLAEA